MGLVRERGRENMLTVKSDGGHVEGHGCLG